MSFLPEYEGLRGLESNSLAQQAYRALRDAVIAGQLGPGDRITERGLAHRLAVSPTPVREALRRLEQDGLIVRTGARTIRVANFDLLTARGSLLAVSRLTALLARLAAANATPDHVAQMAECLDEADAERAELRRAYSLEDAVARGSSRIQALFHEFHLLVIEAAGNAVVAQLLRTAEGVAGAGGTPKWSTPARLHGPQVRYDQHRRLLDAVQRRDQQGAEELMADHLRYVGEIRG